MNIKVDEECMYIENVRVIRLNNEKVKLRQSIINVILS